MRKKPVVRWQLWMLGGVTLLLLYRVMAGPPAREGLVVLERMEERSLHHRSFEVDRTIQVSIEGKGSFENLESSDGTLAAYAWIIDDETRLPVWQMDRENSTRLQGTLAETHDVLKLEAGKYHLFFASYGNQLRGRHDRDGDDETQWEKDWREWFVVLNLVEGKETDVRSTSYDDENARSFSSERIVWASGPTKNRESQEYLFHVKTPTACKVRATGEISDDANDFGIIENKLTGENVWQMTLDNSEPAGGAEENRTVSEEITLAPGIYRIAYSTDATHAFNSWKGNPPFDPQGWGLTLTTQDTSEPIAAFDPWQTGQPIVSLIQNVDDQMRAVTFRLSEKLRVVLFGMGEMKKNDRYDFGWIERFDDQSPNRTLAELDDFPERPNGDRTIWEMKYEGSTPAGGDDTNRRMIAFVDLLPDTYTMYYRTDGSHSYEDWTNGEPADGEHWGISLFTLDGKGRNSFQIVDELNIAGHEEEEEESERHFEETIEAELEEHAETLEAEIAELAERAAAQSLSMTLNLDANDVILVEMNQLGNNKQMKESLELSNDTRVRILSVGEITPSGKQYDYGYIERDGNKVWELTLSNTKHAGGGEDNRIFDDVVNLPAGSYTFYFKTDETHSFPDFDTDPPDMPAAWGMTVIRDR